MRARAVAGAAALVLAVACGGAPAAESPSAALGAALERFDLVDLSHTYDDETLYWPTAPSHFELERLAYGPTEAGFFYSANVFCTPEHGGTHLDAPIHFAAGRRTAAEVPVDQLVGSAFVIDVTEQAAADPDYRLTPADVAAWEDEHGRIPPGAIVLLRTGWSRYWPDRVRYFGSAAPDDASDLHFPSYGAEAAELLVSERGAGVLGVDTASIDYGPSTDFPVHRIAAAAEVVGIENLAGLDRLPAVGAWVAALPMKIAGGSGGPVRAVAWVPRH